MNVLHRIPPAPLDACIETLWWSRRAAPYPVCEHMLPSGTVQLIVALHEETLTWAGAAPDAEWYPWSGGIVHGPQSRFYRAGPKPAGAVVGAVFRPGAAGAILGVPAAELIDRHVRLDELWGNGARALHERLGSSANATVALSRLEQALLARLRTPLLMHPAVAYALFRGETRRIGDVRRETGYSHRHFVALFRTAVGHSPKQFFRIRRFASAARRLAAGESSLGDLAALTGYADQAHFSREFRALCGVPPSAYRPRAPDSPHHHIAG